MTETKKKTTQARTSTARAQGSAKDAARDTTEAAPGFGGAATDKAASAARTVQRTAVSAAGATAGAAGVVWSIVKARKTVVAGAGTGVVTAVAGSYALGRRSGLRQRGPLSRLTGGRL